MRVKTKGKKKSVLVNKEEELKNQLARTLADYDNLRKRAEKEKGEIIKLANLGFFLRLTPIIDNLKKAQDHLKDEGLENIIMELLEIITDEGIENIEAEKGMPFDENYHEATEVEDTKDKSKSGTISKVLLEGWRIKRGPVIRPAKVVVYKTVEEN
jgi:molecular chaperone GrpE